VYNTPVSSKFMENFVLLNAALVAVCRLKADWTGGLVVMSVYKNVKLNFRLKAD
jgi:hypothetical protein